MGYDPLTRRSAVRSGDPREGGAAAATLAIRLAGAVRLDRRIYAELVVDAGATSQALWLVAILGMAHGAGNVVRGLAFGWNPWEGALFGLTGEVIFFVVSSLAIYVLGRFALGATAIYGQVLRPLAFSSEPGFLILIAAALSLLSQRAAYVFFPVIIAWRLAAGFVAVREALGLSKARSMIVLGAGVVLGVAAVGAGSGLLVLLLE
ncbi:MAG: hypothetical protein M3354_02815 [Chloroflexota bacterium]|nr:hypothetical protein [Chloroflexota bacterium]